MAAGVAAAQGDQDIVGAKAAMHETLLSKPMSPVAMLGVVFAVAELADALHALDRTLGLGEQEVLRLLPAVQPAPATICMCSGARITTLWPKVDAAVVGHGVGHRAQDLLGRVAAMVLDIAEAAAA
jgi:hypothetical protein